MTHNEQTAWEKAFVTRIGKRIAALREKQKISAQTVADRTAILDYPVSRNSVVDLELGRRNSISVAQLCVLAEALGVSPVELLYPVTIEDLDEERVEYLPGKKVSTGTALGWFTGKNRPAVSALLSLEPMLRARDAVLRAQSLKEMGIDAEDVPESIRIWYADGGLDRDIEEMREKIRNGG